MDNIVVRTDLAVEANEEAMNGTGKLRGIRLRESNKSRMGVQVGTKNMQKKLYRHWQDIYLSF